MSKKYMRDMVPLVVICLVSALLLASFNLLTKDPIQQNSQRAAEETRTRMLPIASSFEPMEVPKAATWTVYTRAWMPPANLWDMSFKPL